MMSFNTKFNIALGKSRNDKKWQNKQWTWEQLVDRIRETHRTAETVAEYFEMKRERQDEIKDIGGFVGGHLSGGRRLKHAVTSRQVLTLDADAASPEFWDKFTLHYGCAAAVYSTHKHTEEKPRLRLLIPLDREVFPDEYIAIGRRIAGEIGIDEFDYTGFQPSRLMYWPSTSKDGVYYFREQVGDIMDADSILATYKDWQDVSEWPMCSSERKLIAHEIKKQGDPLEKPGLIGAYCRAFDIQAVIDRELSDIYKSCDIENRYTYIAGSTSAGVVIYEDKFAFSHHSTDPCGSMLCNAFDLVRIHKFGLLDETTEADVPVNKRPSYLAMCDYVANDNIVKQQLGEAKLANAKDAFAEVGVEVDEADLEWLKEMDVDRKGNYLCTINNIALILEFDPIFKGNIAFDEFKQQAIFKKDLPWRKIAKGVLLTDNDLANIENYIEKVYKLACGTRLTKGLLVVLTKFSFHPVTDYLKAQKWDGKERIENLLIKYLGAENTTYVKTVTRKSLVACVARVMEPGIKFDYVLTLVGEEGQGKSQLWDKLGGKWFSDTFNLHMLQSKEAYEQIQGIWIIEIGELAGMAKAEVERVKSFISARQDNYRSPYGRTTEQRLRQCVFFASTNLDDFLKSQTGNRRFWPVRTFANKPTGSVYDMTVEEVNQIWAEAMWLYMEGEELYLKNESAKEAKEMQEVFTEKNPLIEQIQHFLNIKIPANWYTMSRWDKINHLENYDDNAEGLQVRDRVCKYEIWELVLKQKDPITPIGWKQIKTAMAKVEGWVKLEEQMRFGNSYPRHTGSYAKAFTIHELLG